MNNKESKRRRLITKKWIRGILVTLLSVLVVSVGLIIFTWANRSTIIDLVQEWYALNHTGELEIGEVISNFSDFPKIGFTIHDIRHADSDSVTDKSVSIEIQKADIVVRTFDLLFGDLNITEVAISDARLISEVHPTRPFSYYINLKLEKNNRENEPFYLPGFMDASGAEFLVEHSRLLLKDTTLNKYFEMEIDRFEGEYTVEDDQVRGEADMNVMVRGLGFNMLKGAYLKNTRVTGRPAFSFDRQHQEIRTDTFRLSLNDEHYETAASFNLTDSAGYAFYLANEETDLSVLGGLLADSLEAKIAPFQLFRPFKTEATIRGRFGYGQFPLVIVDFSTTDNRLVLADQIELDQASFTGHLTTDIYATDSIRLQKRSREDVRITIDSLTALTDDIQVKFRPSYFQSSPDALNYLNSSVEMQGSNEALARLVGTDNFEFTGGTFDLKASISGDIPNPSEIFNYARGSFSLQNTRVTLKRNQLGLPIEKLTLQLERDVAVLRHLEIRLPDSDNIIFTGRLTHPGDLLTDDNFSRTTGYAELIADHIDVDEIIAISTRLLADQGAATDQKNLHETIEVLHRRFDPELRVDVKSLSYKGIELNNVRASLNLHQPEVVSVPFFEFDFNESVTSVSGTVQVPPPRGSVNQPVSVDMRASSRGKVTALRDLFRIQLMDVLSGEFDFEGAVDARVNRFQDLLYHIRGELVLRDNTYFYVPADLRIHLDSLKLDVERSSLLLDDFAFDMGNYEDVRLQGSVSRYPDFLLGKEATSGSVDVRLHFPRLNADTVRNLIKKVSTANREGPEREKKKLYTVFKDLNHFDPSIQVTIDSLSYKDLNMYDISSRIAFENDSVLSMENFDIYYKQSRAQVNGRIMAPEASQTMINNDPFEFEVTVIATGPNTDLNDLLGSTNFLFQTGSFEFSGTYQGESESLALVEQNATAALRIGPSLVHNTTAGLDIPIDSLAVEINNNLATLTYLDMDLPGKSSLDFSGTINNFTSFINSDSGRHSSAFQIKSDYLDIEDLDTFFDSGEAAAKDSANLEADIRKIRETLDEIIYSFNPTLSLYFDSLLFKDQMVNDFRTSFSFDNDGDLVAEKMSMNIYDGSVDLTFRIGNTEQQSYPVDIKMNIAQLNLNKMITDLNYFGNEELREADRIEGIADLQVDLRGRFDEQGKLLFESLNGKVSLALHQLKLYGYDPLLDKVVLFSKERFEKLQFQPIVQTLDIKNGEILIPRTEVQSSALQLFIEGQVRLEDYLDIWISVPWKNLGKNDGLTLPAKTTFEKAGGKFYIQLVQDPDHPRPSARDMGINIRFSNRVLRRNREK